MAASAAEPIDREVILGHLMRHRMLGLLDRPSLERLIGFAKPRKLAARARLFAAGDPGRALYVVLSGWITLSREGPNGRDVLLELAGAGSVFGELSVICGLPRGTGATSLVAASLLAIDGRMLLQTLRLNPDALLEMTRMLGERLTRANRQLEEALFLSAEARLARALIRLAALSANSCREGLQIDLGLSQKQLGEMTGLTRESTNRQLALWRDAGLIGFSGRTLTLIDSAAVGEIAQLGA